MFSPSDHQESCQDHYFLNYLLSIVSFVSGPVTGSMRWRLFLHLGNFFAKPDVGSGQAQAVLKTADLLDLVTHHVQVEGLEKKPVDVS